MPVTEVKIRSFRLLGVVKWKLRIMFEARASFALPTGSRVSNTRIPPRAIRCSDQLFSRETFVGHEGSGRVERYFGCSFCEGAHLEMRKAPCESAFCEGAHFLYPRLLTEMSNTNALVPVHHAIQSMNHQEVLRHVFRVFGAVFPEPPMALARNDRGHRSRNL